MRWGSTPQHEIHNRFWLEGLQALKSGACTETNKQCSVCRDVLINMCLGNSIFFAALEKRSLSNCWCPSVGVRSDSFGAWLLQGPTVEPQTLLDVSGAVPEAVTDALLAACRTNTFSNVQTAITNAIADGWGVRHSAPSPPTWCCYRQRPMHACRSLLRLVDATAAQLLYLRWRCPAVRAPALLGTPLSRTDQCAHDESSHAKGFVCGGASDAAPRHAP